MDKLTLAGKIISKAFKTLFVGLFLFYGIVLILSLFIPGGNVKDSIAATAILTALLVFFVLPVKFYHWILKRFNYNVKSLVVFNISQMVITFNIFLFFFLALGLSSNATEDFKQIPGIILFCMIPALIFNVIYFILFWKEKNSRGMIMAAWSWFFAFLTVYLPFIVFPILAG